MSSARTSLRFVVGTALLTTAGAAAGVGCNTRTSSHPRPEEPYSNTGPMQPDRPLDEPPEVTGGEEPVNPGQGPIVNTAPPPDADPPTSPPIVNTAPPDPKALEPATVNIRTADPAPKKAPKAKPGASIGDPRTNIHTPDDGG